MCVVPSINDDEDNIRAIIALLKDNGHSSLTCLAYHKMGEAKLARLKTSLKPMLLMPAASAHQMAICDAFEKGGIHARVLD